MTEYNKIFNNIKSEGFGEEIALNATILIAINCTLNPTNLEMLPENNGVYTSRLKKQFDNVLWELSEEDKALALQLWEAHHTYDISNSLAGLGGCKAKTYKQIIDESRSSENVEVEKNGVLTKGHSYRRL